MIRATASIKLRVRRAVRAVAPAGLALAVAGFARPADAADVIVRPLVTHQRIDGFGASSAWTAPAMSAADSDLAFSVDAGAGLSLLRVRIAPDGTCGEVATAQSAIARGAHVWATPWQPPPEWKSGANDAGYGGSLLPEHYDDWANRLATAVQTLQGQGVDLLGLSAQNEPTNNVQTYESCIYSAAQLVDFIGHHLGPALADAGLGDGGPLPLGVIAPETQDWNSFATFQSAIEADPSASSQIGVMAAHSYGGEPAAYPDITDAGQALWETETYDPAQGADPGMPSALWVAHAIQQAMVVANLNAWHYWWLYPSGPGGRGGLWDQTMTAGTWQTSPTKRLFVLGNYSRFVRPGFLRVEATASPQCGKDVEVSAYYDAPSQSLVIVAINADTASVTQGFSFDGVVTSALSPWVTSSSQSLSPGDPIAAGSRVVATLPAQSVTTLTAQVTGMIAPLEADAGSGEGGDEPCDDSVPAPADAPGCGLACSAAASRPASRSARASVLALAALALARRATRKRPRPPQEG